MTAPALLTEAQAAEALQLCTRTLRKARQEGKLSYVLIGRAVRYTMDDLHGFIEVHTMKQAPAPRPRPSAARRATAAGNVVPFSQRGR